MQANVSRGLAIEVVPSNRISHLVPQLVPGVGLSEDGLRKALGGVPTVGLLGHIEDERRRPVHRSAPVGVM